jgi:hypothetical protein
MESSSKKGQWLKPGLSRVTTLRSLRIPATIATSIFKKYALGVKFLVFLVLHAPTPPFWFTRLIMTSSPLVVYKTSFHPRKSPEYKGQEDYNRKFQHVIRMVGLFRHVSYNPKHRQTNYKNYSKPLYPSTYVHNVLFYRLSK